MVGSIARLRRLVAQDPAPWLLAGTALLTLGIWAAPVPELVFGMPAGSSSTNPCSCSTDACEDWSVTADESDCNSTEVWEDCTGDFHDEADCGGVIDAKNMPRTKWVYETKGKGNPWCNNTADSGAGEDVVQWDRSVNVTVSGNSGSQVIDFEPRLDVDFSGFTESNVCNDNIGNQIDIESGLYAAMRLPNCGNKWLVDDENHTSTGWTFTTHTFERVKEGENHVWKFTTGGTAFEAEDFSISKSCSCGFGGTIDQRINFQAQVVRNTGVEFGEVGADAIVIFEALDDDTSCTAVNN